MKRTWRVRPSAAAVCAVILAVTVSAGSAVSQPAGNNGTVKVDGVEFDSHPDNQPHVGCVFQIDFYNFDGGGQATVAFEAVPPTPGGPLLNSAVQLGPPDPEANDLNASATYDLGDALGAVEPHPVQGHHVRLEIHAEGSIGNDVKHKVFWVEGCGRPPTTTTAPPPTTSPTTAPPTTAHPPATSAQPSRGGAPSGDQAGRPGSVGQTQAPPARAVPSQPQFTG